MENQLKKVKFVQLRSIGKTYTEISEELKVSKPTLIEWSKLLQAEINNEIEIRREEVQKKYRLDFERQIELKAKILNKLEQELLESDLSDIPKAKLIELILKITDSLSDGINFKFKGIDIDCHSIVHWNG